MSEKYNLIDMLLGVVLGNRLALIDLIFDLLQRLPLIRSLPGMYEVLDFEAELELKDSKGRTAIYRKMQKVRFIQDNIIAYQDVAWGDGDIFTDYKCAPGVEVDRYREGHRYNILISLRETKQRDDRETLHIERTIRGGFVTDAESFQVDIDHRTRHLAFGVIFPGSRLPTAIRIIQQNRKQTRALGKQDRQNLPDGRVKYVWKTDNPRLFESFIMRWEW